MDNFGTLILIYGIALMISGFIFYAIVKIAVYDAMQKHKKDNRETEDLLKKILAKISENQQ